MPEGQVAGKEQTGQSQCDIVRPARRRADRAQIGQRQPHRESGQGQRQTPEGDGLRTEIGQFDQDGRETQQRRGNGQDDRPGHKGARVAGLPRASGWRFQRRRDILCLMIGRHGADLC